MEKTGTEKKSTSKKSSSKKTAKESVSVEGLTLEQIRATLAKVEKQRAKKTLGADERLALEETALTLRDAERSAINDLQTDLIKGFETETAPLSLQAKEIRKLIKKLNTVPKVLDTTETVVKECVSVLKLIAKFTLMLVLALTVVSCATMSKAQIKKVNALAVTSDSVALAPSVLLEKLADVRQERGLFFAASLSDADNRISELNALSKAHVQDEKSAAKADVYIKVLNSYLRALKSLCAESRPERYGTELRGIGRNLDSLLINYNNLEWSEEIETGFSRQVGKTSGYLAEQYVSRRQRYLLKQMLITGDTLVTMCCDSLTAMLRKQEMKRLIDNEELGLEANYRSYLNAMAVQDRLPLQENDRKYLELKADIADARTLQSKCASALQSLKKAHHSLLLEMDKAATYQEYSDRLTELATQSAALKTLISD